MKVNLAVTPKEIALPLEVVYSFHKKYWVVGVRLLFLFMQITHINKEYLKARTSQA